MKTKKTKPSLSRLRISPMLRTPGSDSEERGSSSPCPESPVRSSGPSFKLSRTCAGNLDLAEMMKTRSLRHQSRIKSPAIQIAIKLIYKYRARSISELFDKCSSDEFSSLVYFAPDYTKIVQPALDLFIKDSLELQRKCRWEYLLAHSAYNEAEECEILRLFTVQGIDPIYFAKCLQKVLKCEQPKVNTIRIIGIANSGKSLIAQLLCQCFISCYANNHGSENEFFLSNFLNKAVVLCEELYVTQATCEDFKSILGGAPIDISKKFHEKQILSRTPVIVTSNFGLFGRGHLSNIDENALASRCFTFKFGTMFVPRVQITAPSMYHFLWLCVNQDLL